MSTALLIIDMQAGSFTEDARRDDPRPLVDRLNALAERIRASSGLVIFIQHDGPPGNVHHPDAPGWKLLADLIVSPADNVVRKTSCDAFLDTALQDILTEHAVRRLVLTGSATDYCVDTTVRSALARGYDVTVPADGHTTSDTPHLSAQQIITHHNAIWADFVSPGGAARICKCSELR